MKIILLIICIMTNLFADVMVLREIEIKINKFSSYTMQTICKDGYQYTVVIKDSNISITQDFGSFAGTDSRIIKCNIKGNK